MRPESKSNFVLRLIGRASTSQGSEGWSLWSLSKHRVASSVILIILTLTVGHAGTIPTPQRDPVPSTPEQSALIKEGIRLHDQAEYEKAIEKYQEVLKANPDNVGALYEMSYSQYMMKDLSAALSTASKGAEYRSNLLDQFYLQMGNCLDTLGRTNEAIEVYKTALRTSPTDSLLYFNLGLAEVNVGKPKEAEQSYEQALRLNPAHPGSHKALGQLYAKSNRKVSALLAYLRFLGLEPQSPRAAELMPEVEELLKAGVSQTGEKQFNLSVFIGKDKKGSPEIDDSTMSLSLARTSALMEMDNAKPPTEIQVVVKELNSFFAMIGESAKTKKTASFVANFYLPYFLEMQKKQWVEPFCYYIFQGKKDAQISQWLKDHPIEVQGLLEWSKNYSWLNPSGFK